MLSRFDVVLTDLMMPGMSGEELLAKVKLQYPATQVVVLTAHGTIDSAVQAMKNGAFYYLTKPTDREALVMTVGKAAELVESPAGESNPAHADGGQAPSRGDYRTGPGDPGR